MSSLLWALIIMASMALVLGAALGLAAIVFKVEGNPIADQIDAVLPQTQCGQCGHPGCRPYAEALAAGQDAINLCPPGGEEGIQKIADILGVEFIPFDEGAAAIKPKSVAYIREPECIGCTLCIQACPVDAILGSAKWMHTVIADECTGCELCLAPCPVDCIEMRPIPTTINNWKWAYPTFALKQIRSENNH